MEIIHPVIRKYILLVLLSFQGLCVLAQSGVGYNRNYTLLRSGNTIADKNFYLLTAISQSPEVIKALSGSEALAAVYRTRRTLIHAHATDAIKSVDSLVSGFTWRSNDSAEIDQVIRSLYSADPAPFDRLVNGHLRPSGCYQRFVDLDNITLLLQAWGQYFRGVNHLFGQFALGEKLRYAAIDSASYDVKGNYYQSFFKSLFNVLDEQTAGMPLFYQPSLDIALRLMDYNNREEPSQFEPLEVGENKAAFRQVKQTNWAGYSYSVLLVPGEGPELTTVALSPGGKMRCELAAERFKKGLAPFIILSGGNCHPFHTPFNEAKEMKQYLLSRFAIPESAIIMEPQARHTTTNFRNANRLLIRYGIPADKPALCVTTIDQAAYIENPRFDNRNRVELGYLPYRNKQRLSVHELVFYPVLECLHMDPADPLDP